MTSFAAGEQSWIGHLGNLRNVVRQEVIARQIAPLAIRGTTVLDVGCSQGTQGLRPASSGCGVTGVDPSSELTYSADATIDVAVAVVARRRRHVR
jgi:2-polyprenyl-3-methyl-5-hydroxy-6-metoxy-1,4-benzoquinol methylase